MKPMRIAMTCVVAIALLAAALNLKLAAQEKKPPENVQGKSWLIVLKDVAVQPKNNKEEHWDAFEGKPDIRVYLKNLSEPKSKDFTSETKMDTLKSCFPHPRVRVNGKSADWIVKAVGRRACWRGIGWVLESGGG